MGKINIKLVIKGSDTYTYEGKAIYTNNTIIFNDGVNTKITLGDTIWIERKKDYLLRLGFKHNQIIKGTYIMKEGKLDISTDTFSLVRANKHIKINYSLDINSVKTETFEINLFYSIDNS